MNKYEKAFLEKHLNIIDKIVVELFEEKEVYEKHKDELKVYNDSFKELWSMKVEES